MAFVISILCGLLLSWPFRSYDGSAPAWFALAPVFWIVARAENKRRAVAYAACFALAWTLSSLTFIWHLTAPGTILLAMYMSMYFVIALLLIRRLAKLGVVNVVFGAAAVWAVMEVVRSTIPVLAFPWLLLGHTLLYNEWLRQGADLLGVYGLSFLIVMVNAALAFAIPAWLPSRFHAAFETNIKSGWRASSMTAIMVLGALYYGFLRSVQIAPRLQAGPPIGLIQGNIIQKLDRTQNEMDAQLVGHLEMHRQLASHPEKPILICWAETMVPGTINSGASGELFKKTVAEHGIATIAGSNYLYPEEAMNELTSNAAFLVDGKGNEVLHYLKQRCVPFGEYIPFARRFPLLKSLRSITRDQYIPGNEPSAICNVPITMEAGAEQDRYRIALNICVEDIHADLARDSARAGADTLINITNDGWFYDTFGPRGHLQAAAWRAIEVRRPLLRVTNTGRTVAVDPLGEIDLLMPEATAATCVTHLKRIAPKAGVESRLVTLTMLLGDLGAGLVFASILAVSLLVSSKIGVPHATQLPHA